MGGVGDAPLILNLDTRWTLDVDGHLQGPDTLFPVPTEQVGVPCPVVTVCCNEESNHLSAIPLPAH